MGLRKKEDFYSHNEMKWWQAFRACQPTEFEQREYSTGRIMTSFRGGKASDYMHDGFDLKHDEDWRKERDRQQREKLRELQQKLNKKLEKEKAENG